MAIDVLKLYEEATNGGDKGKSGICKEIIEETVKALKVLKEKKGIEEIGRSQMTAIVKAMLVDKKKVKADEFKLEYATLTYAWGSTKAKESGLVYDNKKKVMRMKK